MRRISFALAGLLLLPLAAKADTFKYNITGSGSGFSGSGVLTATSQGNGSYLVTNITGTGVTGLIAPFDPTYAFGNNNLLYPGKPGLFDNSGIAFYGAFGSANLFLASLPQGYEVQGYDADGDYFDTPVRLTVTNTTAVTPEPSSLLLSMTGLLGGAASFLRRRSASTRTA